MVEYQREGDGRWFRFHNRRGHEVRSLQHVDYNNNNNNYYYYYYYNNIVNNNIVTFCKVRRTKSVYSNTEWEARAVAIGGQHW